MATQVTLNDGSIDSAGSLALKTNGTTTAITIGTNQNVNFSATGQRITGDFSNGTLVNRVMFQTSTTNGNTKIDIIPNGSSVISGFSAQNSSDPTNASVGELRASSTEIQIFSRINGTGTYLPMTFLTGGSERVRIDTSGNVGIGTTVASTINAVNGVGNLVVGSGSGSEGITIYTGTTDAGGIAFADGTTTTDTYRGYINYAHSTDHMAFWTAATERMRIDSSGNLLVGTTSNSVGGVSTKVGVNGDFSGSYGIAVNSTVGSGNAYQINFGFGGTQKGYIFSSSGGTTYATVSDYRLKEDVAPMTGALTKVAQLKPVTYKWKVDGSDGQGFIAHELAEIVPQCVHGKKDAVDDEGNPVYQGIDTSFLVATLTAAIQELKLLVDTQASTITQLQADVAALKGTA